VVSARKKRGPVKLNGSLQYWPHHKKKKNSANDKRKEPKGNPTRAGAAKRSDPSEKGCLGGVKRQKIQTPKKLKRN